MPRLIFLIGMPGAGKTFWGRQLAPALRIQFVDLDEYIVEHEHAGISLIFEDSGEPVFRQIETKYLMQLVSSVIEDTVIACGGGTPCFNNNMQLMKDAGTVIYLQTSIPQLLSNLSSDNEPRPLLRERSDLSGFLQRLLE